MNAQDYGKGAVSAIFDIQGVKMSVGGDLDVKFVFATAGVPEIRLKWNWLQIGWIDYKGIRYASTNNPMNVDFGYMRDYFQGEVAVLAGGGQFMLYIPQQEISETVYAGSRSTTFTFKMNNLSNIELAERVELGKKLKEDWEATVFPFTYHNLQEFQEGLALVRDLKCGFINRDGDFVIVKKYSSAESFSEGLALVQKKKKFGFIDKNGNEVIPI